MPGESPGMTVQMDSIKSDKNHDSLQDIYNRKLYGKGDVQSFTLQEAF